MYSNNFEYGSASRQSDTPIVNQSPLDSSQTFLHTDHRTMKDAPISTKLLNEIVDAKLLRDMKASEGESNVKFIMRNSQRKSDSVSDSESVSIDQAAKNCLPFVTHVTWKNCPKSENSTDQNNFYVDRLHPRDLVAVIAYVQTQKTETVTQKSWLEYCRNLLAASESCRNHQGMAIIDFVTENETSVDKLITQIKVNDDNPNRRYDLMKREIVCFFNWYNEVRDDVITSLPSGEDQGSHSHDSTLAENRLPNVTTSAQLQKSEANRNDLEWMGRTVRDISQRTGIPVWDIKDISPLIEVNGFPLYTSTATRHGEPNSVGLTNFLRYVEPAIDENGNGMASFHLRDTAYVVVLAVNRDTGEITDIDIQSEDLDWGGKHPTTMTIGQLEHSLRNRIQPGWLRNHLALIGQQTGIEESAVEYVHYLAEKNTAPLFMTADTAAKAGCSP